MDKKRENYGPKPILLWIIALILLVTIFFIMRSSLFNITDISVIGCARFSPQQIIDASGINYDTNIIAVDKQQAKENIERNSFLKVTSIKRVFPTGIEIYVSERSSAAQIGAGDGYYIIDKDCVALSKNEMADGTLALILNMGIFEPVFGTTVVSDDEAKTEAASAVLNAMDEYALIGKITEIDVEDPSKILLTYENEYKIRIAGASTARTKLARVEATVEAVRDKLTDGKMLHMENEGGYYIK